MQNPFQQKVVDSKEPEAMKIRKLDLLSDVEHVEIKKLDAGDVKEVFLIMRKTLWEATEAQVQDVVKYGYSYGAYVERMLAGAGLAWPASYDEKMEKLSSGNPNALYLEDVALLLAYEGKGIRHMLIDAREKAAVASGFQFVVALISPDWREGMLEDAIKERGNNMEKAYASKGYKFIRGKDGIFAVKRIGR